MLEEKLFSEKNKLKTIIFSKNSNALILIKKEEELEDFIKKNSVIILTTFGIKISPNVIYIFKYLDTFFEKNKVKIDNIFSIPIISEKEKQFFLFFEKLKESNSHLLITANNPINKWDVVSEDLISKFKIIHFIK